MLYKPTDKYFHSYKKNGGFTVPPNCLELEGVLVLHRAVLTLGHNDQVAFLRYDLHDRGFLQTVVTPPGENLNHGHYRHYRHTSSLVQIDPYIIFLRACGFSRAYC